MRPPTPSPHSPSILNFFCLQPCTHVLFTHDTPPPALRSQVDFDRDPATGAMQSKMSKSLTGVKEMPSIRFAVSFVTIELKRTFEASVLWDIAGTVQGSLLGPGLEFERSVRAGFDYVKGAGLSIIRETCWHES